MQPVSSEAVWAGTVDFDISLKEGEHGYLYIPGTEPETVTINGQEQKSDYWNNNFLDLGTYDTDTVVHVTAFFPADGSEEWKGYHSCSKGWNAPSQHIL